MDDFRVEDLFSYLNGLNNIFDVVRIVNPKIKEIVYENCESQNTIHGDNCYEYWDKGEACDNCISAKAIREKRTITKIEYKEDNIFIVMSTPMIFGDSLYIVEMIKEISEVIMESELSMQREVSP